MSYPFSDAVPRAGPRRREQEDAVTDTEHLHMPSTCECCVCGRVLSIREEQEFYAVTDETLHGDVHCPSCAARGLTLCRECSCRYTADHSGMCGECQMHTYAHIFSS